MTAMTHVFLSTLAAILLFIAGCIAYIIFDEIIGEYKRRNPKKNRKGSATIKVNGKEKKVSVEYTADNMICVTTELSDL